MEISNYVQYLSASNAFGASGVLDKHGNIFGAVFAVFGIIMILFSIKVKKMGSFYLEMENHDPVIKETGYLPAKARIADRRESEIAGKTFSEMELVFEYDGEVYEKWTPDLGLDGEINIEYDPNDPSSFYITEEADIEQSPDKDDNGDDAEELDDPPNKAFIAMLVFGIALLALGCGFLYDFYFIRS